MEKLLKDQLIFIALVIVAFVGGGIGAYSTWTAYSEINEEKTQKEQELQLKSDEVEKLLANKKAAEAKEVKEEVKKSTSTSGKVIYEVSGQQFTPEASFGIMFENILSNVTNSGIRIRSINYSYSLPDDKIISAGGGNGYNACELAFVTVGTYAQFQNFFKNIAKENYLSSIYEVYIEPYDKDKTILITKFKIRLYTKTV